MKELLRKYLEQEKGFKNVKVNGTIDEGKSTLTVEITHNSSSVSEYTYVNVWNVLVWIYNLNKK